MTHRVDPCVESMQPTSTYPPIDLFPAPSRLHQLHPPHHTVLPSRQFRERVIVSTRPQKVVLYKGFCGLGG